jgi:hypothetical protein
VIRRNGRTIRSCRLMKRSSATPIDSTTDKVRMRIE